MCGKFNVILKDGTSKDVFPGGTCEIITLKDGVSEPERAEHTWGLKKRDGSGLIFNARAETVAEKPIFSKDFCLRRAVVPIARFSEWSPRDAEGKKHEYHFSSPAPIYLAGFFSRFNDNRFVVLTTAATKSAAIHSRFPLLLTDRNRMDYLSDLAFASIFLHSQPLDLLCNKAY